MFKNEITIDPHYLSGEKETWMLKFEHKSYRSSVTDYNLPQEERNPVKVGILLYVIKEGKTPSLTESVEIAQTSFLLNEKPERLRMVSHPDADDFIQALVEQGYAKQVGSKVEKVQDCPGSEIEEFKYSKLDVTDYYNSYISGKIKEMDNSPISDIQLCEIRDDPYSLSQKPLDYLKCRIGGVEQDRQWVGMDGILYSQTADLYPDSRYQLYELAAKAHSKQIQLYQTAWNRVTEASLYEAKGEFRMRCKIDGVQQLSKQVSRSDVSTYLAYKDMYILAVKYYKDELADGIVKNITRSR